MLPYLLPFKLKLVLVLGIVLLYTVLGLIGPYLMGLAIDRFIATKDIDGLAKIAILMLVVFFLNNVFQAVSAWMMSDVSQRALKQLRADLFARLQQHYDDDTIAELTMIIAWENASSRFNRAFRIPSQGFWKRMNV